MACHFTRFAEIVNYGNYPKDMAAIVKGRACLPRLRIVVCITLKNESMKKYFKNRRDALQECALRNASKSVEWYKVFKMPKGTRHHGEYAVCSEMEFLNTY